jgi:hypothetical protein
MLYVIEPQCIGVEHAPFNAGLLATLRAALPLERITFFAEYTHLAEVQSLMPMPLWESLTVHSLLPPCRSHADTSLKRLPAEKALIEEVLRNAHGQGCHRVMFTSITAAGIIALKETLNRYPALEAHAVLHGILSTLPIKSLSLKKLFGNAFRPAFLMPAHPRLRYVVLGQSIKHELTKGMLAHLADQIDVLDHPLIYPALAERSQPRQQGELRFATFGGLHPTKGGQAFFDVARANQSAVESETASFHVLGHIADAKLLQRLEEGCVIARENAHQPMERTEIAALAQTMDYALFCYRPEDYRLRASGALFDAFAYGLPILALRNPFFEQYWERFGNIGTLCDSIEALQAEVHRLITEGVDEATYTAQRNTLMDLRDALSPQGLALDIQAMYAAQKARHAHATP